MRVCTAQILWNFTYNLYVTHTLKKNQITEIILMHNMHMIFFLLNI